MRRIATLGELCTQAGGEIKTGPFGSQLHQSDYSEEGTPVIMPKDIRDGSIDVADIARVAADHVERLARHKIVPGDIVFPRRGEITKHAFVREREAGWLCGTGCLRIRPGAGNLDPAFLHYYLYHAPVLEWIEGQAVGSTMANLNTGILESLEVEHPSKVEQRRIASVLSTYDDLIENNQRRIKLLEDMAQLLYREWFVYYRFPGHEDVEFVDSELGPIPEGWEACKFTDFADVLSGGTPKKSEPAYWSGDIPFFTPKDTQSGFFVLDCADHVTPYGVSKCNSKLYDPRTVFITARGTVGRVAMPTAPMAMNQSCYALKSHEGYSQEWLFLTTKHKVDYLKKNTGGATFDTIIVDTFRLMDAVRPKTDIVQAFADTVAPLFDLIENGEHQVKRLRAARDLLLPRLISGKLDVSNLPIEVRA